MFLSTIHHKQVLNAQQRSPRYGEENTVLVKGIAFVVVYWGSGETAA